MKTSKILHVLFLVVHQLLGVPVVWLWYQIYQQRTSVIYRKRLVNSQLAFTAIILAYVMIFSPFRLITTIFPNWRNTNKQIVPSLLTANLSICLWHSIEFARCWILYYRLRLSQASTKKEWSLLLNDTFGCESELISTPIPLDTISEETSQTLTSVNHQPSVNNSSRNPSMSNSQTGSATTRMAEQLVNSNQFDTNWFIRNWNRFGNRRWVLIRAIFIGALVYCLMAIMFVMVRFTKLPETPAFLTSLIIFTGIRLAFVCLYFKTPVINDCIFLRYELKWAAIINACIILCLLICLVLYQLLNVVSFATFVILTTIGLDLVLLGYLIILFYVIPLKLKQSGMEHVFLDGNNNNNQNQRSSHRMSTTLGIVNRTQSMNVSGKKNKANRELLSKLINSNAMFQLLMDHLLTEFNSECLLSVIEFIQFKQVICHRLGKVCQEYYCGSDTMNNNNHNNHGSIPDDKASPSSPSASASSPSAHDCPSKLHRLVLKDVKLPKCVDFGGIIQLYRHKKISVLETVDGLYNKYISDDSSLQINISFVCREHLMRNMHDLRLKYMGFGSSNDSAHGYSRDKHGLELGDLANSLVTDIKDDKCDDDPKTPPSNDNPNSLAHRAQNSSIEELINDEEWLHNVSHLWDACIDDMCALLIHSCQRFIDSPHFQFVNENSAHPIQID